MQIDYEKWSKEELIAHIRFLKQRMGWQEGLLYSYAYLDIPTLIRNKGTIA
jgi:hypothetical protein